MSESEDTTPDTDMNIRKAAAEFLAKYDECGKEYCELEVEGLRAALSTPYTDEPVTPRGSVNDLIDEEVIEDEMLDRNDFVYIRSTPLYTHSLRELSDDEILDAVHDSCFWMRMKIDNDERLIKAVRAAIEAAARGK